MKVGNHEPQEGSSKCRDITKNKVRVRKVHVCHPLMLGHTPSTAVYTEDGDDDDDQE